MSRPSKILAKIRAGKVARICCTGSPLIYMPLMAAHYGYDGVWVDGEHRAWDPTQVREMILRHHHADVDCVFRPTFTERAPLTRCLEDGATGLMIPMVNTAERARQLVEITKFPPPGDRGLDGAGIDAGFLVKKGADYTLEANRQTALIVQIETPEAIENCEAIAAVEGVDILFIGPGDLSLRLGCAASLQEAKLRKAIDSVAAACKRQKKAWGFPAGTIEDVRTLVGLGAQFVNYGSEFMAVMKQLEMYSTQWKEVLGE
jgi:2-keto-3-deoxy-L-rhamnonate aldolase RhmA